MNAAKQSGRSRPPSVTPAPAVRARPGGPAWTLGAGAITVVVLTALWLWRGPVFTLDPRRDQNVLLVTLDTIRADALSAYGGPAQTPNLDRLASHGARFTFAHAHAVVTLPSHTSILTGRLPYEHGMRDNGGFRVKPGTATLATRLKSLGFATGAFVGGFPLTKRFGLTPGFDVYDDQMPELKGIGAVSLPERRADVVVSRAIDWIGQQSGKFFAWVHVFDAHSPYKPPGEYAANYPTQPYYGEVAFVDRALGPLFDRLATLARPTIVIVTADHGESLGEHGEATHGMFAYESTLRVPLIIARVTPRDPGPRGVVIDAPVRHIDIVPTVLDAVAEAADQGLPGSSLRELVRNRSGADRPAYFESMTYNLVRGWAPLRGVLVARDKYIDLPVPELYDLAADSKEDRNRASADPERLRVMLNTLRTFNVAPPNRPGQESAEATAALRSLGYVSGSAPAKAAYTEADDPKNLAALDRDLHTATDLLETGRNDDGIRLLERVLARRPQTADASIALAHAYWEGGRPDRAVEVLDNALRSGSPDRDVRIRLGLYLAESGADPARAIEVLKGLASDDVEALNALGIAYSDAGLPDNAAETFNRVLALDPTNGLAYQNLASVTLRQALAARAQPDRSDRLQRAEAYARRAIEIDASLPDAHTTLGVILSTTGRKNEAIESWKRAVTLDERQFNALYDLWQDLNELGRRDEAVAYGRRFVDGAPPAFFKEDIQRVEADLAR